MAAGSLVNVLPRLRDASLASHEAAGDAELLEHFVSRRDEVAFEVMLRRHGPMVYAVCRRVLRHAQDAEDAFQATFLVLAHKASAVSPRANLAGWLHGVAHKTALKARHRSAHRREVEKRVPPRSTDEMHADASWPEVEPILDQEIAALPDRYRLPIILCDLEGRTRAAVAQTLRCSEGTLSSRLTRGRRLLADRLRRRGVVLSVASVAAILEARSSAPAQSLVLATVPVALSSLAAPAGVGGAASPSVAELATGVMKSMLLKKLRTAAFVALAVAALALSGLAAYTSAAAPDDPRAAPAPAGDDKVAPALTDPEGELLLNRKVLKDMKCDIDQLDRIMDAVEEAQRKESQKVRDVLSGLPSAGAGFDTKARRKMIQDAQQEGEKEFRKAVDVVIATMLTPAQQKRLQEIDLQVRGYDAFAIPAVAKALGLTDKQKEQLAASAKKVEDDILKLRAPAGVGGAAGAGGAGGAIGGLGGGGGIRGNATAVREVRAEGMKRALAILTDEQQATWKKLTGEPFTHPVNLMRRPPNAGGGAGGGGPPPGPTN